MTMDSNTPPHPPMDADLQGLRRQARQRFVGAALLALVAIIVFPLLLDTRPRPVPQDMHIDVQALPTSPSAQPQTNTSAASENSTVPPIPIAPVLSPQETSANSVNSSKPPDNAVNDKSPKGSVAAPEAAIAPQQSKSAAKSPEATSRANTAAGKTSGDTSKTAPVGTPVAKTQHVAPAPAQTQALKADESTKPSQEAHKAAEAARATALLNGGNLPNATATTELGAVHVPASPAHAVSSPSLLNKLPSGYQVQAGSFADKDKLAEVKSKLNKAGIHYYTQEIGGKDTAHRTRIRLGPFASQEQANSVAARINKLGIKTLVLKPSPTEVKTNHRSD